MRYRDSQFLRVLILEISHFRESPSSVPQSPFPIPSFAILCLRDNLL